jgi:hypothetical protein
MFCILPMERNMRHCGATEENASKLMEREDYRKGFRSGGYGLTKWGEVFEVGVGIGDEVR